MVTDESQDKKILRSKESLERTRKAEQAVGAAAEKRKRAQILRSLDSELDFYLWAGLEEARRKGRDPEEIARLEERLRQAQDEAAAVDEQWKRAEEEEELALAELAKATEEFAEATVAPRVEAEKLRFEEHKLRATLSSASIVGLAATVGLLLSKNPTYVPVLGVAFVFLFVSTVFALNAMKEISSHVESTMISATLPQTGRLRTWLTRHTGVNPFFRTVPIVNFRPSGHVAPRILPVADTRGSSAASSGCRPPL